MAALALAVQSCVMFNDKAFEEDPQYESVEYLHDEVLYFVFGAVELADFFDRYQDIREDREAAVALGEEYFGSHFNQKHLVFEEYSGGYPWGFINLTSTPGFYIIRTLLPYSYYQSGDFHVEVTGDREYRIRTVKTKEVGPQSPDFTIDLDCSASVASNGDITVGHLDLKYEEEVGKTRTKAHIMSSSSPVKLKMSRKGNISRIPFAGKLDYDIEGETFSDKFTVEYSEDKFTIL